MTSRTSIHSYSGSVTGELFAWVEFGPPMRNRREFRGAQLFEDDLPSGHRVTYFVDASVPYVAIVHMRRL
jgi:hypothetical protein